MQRDHCGPPPVVFGRAQAATDRAANHDAPSLGVAARRNRSANAADPAEEAQRQATPFPSHGGPKGAEFEMRQARHPRSNPIRLPQVNNWHARSSTNIRPFRRR